MGDLDKAVFALVRAIRSVAGGSATALALQFTNPVVTERDDASIVVAGNLRGALSEKAARVVATGAPVTIRYEGRLTSKEGGGATRQSTAVRVLRYDVLKETYVVEQHGA